MFIYMSTFCLHQTSQNKAQTKTKNKTQNKIPKPNKKTEQN